MEKGPTKTKGLISQKTAISPQLPNFMKTQFVPFTKEIQGSVHRSRKMRNPNSKRIKYIFKYLEISVDFPNLLVTDAMRGSSSDSLSSDGSLISKRILT